MATTRKSPGRKTTARKSAGGITKAKVKRAGRVRRSKWQRMTPA